MRHIPLEGWTEGGKPLPAMRQWSAPNLVCFTRAKRPPVASLVSEPEGAPGGLESEEADPVEESAPNAKSELRGMSAKSALSLARVLSSLEWGKLGSCIHVTLTYWKKWPGSKSELALAKSYITKEVGERCEAGIWRLEYQRRKKPDVHFVPHWHLLVWCGPRDAGEVADSLIAWWSRYANSHDNAVRVTLGDQARGTWYLAMHAAKREQSPPFRVGRWWGYIRRAGLLAAQDFADHAEVAERERVWWARMYRRHSGGRTRGGSGFSWFLPRRWQQEVGRWVRDRIEYEQRTRAYGYKPF